MIMAVLQNLSFLFILLYLFVLYLQLTSKTDTIVRAIENNCFKIYMLNNKFFNKK